ncbi:MAG: DUF4340 domain-containing protein [Clostridia bacterium]|nr:DUF4340 domain-containing protein [Clostridia bacterium]
MSKKSLILACVGVLAAIILAVVYFVLLNTDGEKTPDDSQNTATQYGNIVEVEESELYSLSVSRAGVPQYRIYRHMATDELVLEGYEGNPYSTDFTSAISAACDLYIMEEIEAPLADIEYGIKGEESPYVINISTTNGTHTTLYVGDELVAGNGYYCRMQGDDKVYGIISTTSKLFKSNYDLLSKALAYPLESTKYHYTEKFTLNKDLREFVSVEFVPESERAKGDAFGAYKMTCPAGYTPADVNYDKVLKSLITPSADSIVTTEITPENLEKYGFTVPSYELYYTLDGVKRSIYFGNRTEDGLIYVLSADFGFIGLASVANRFPFLDWELVDFINPALFGMNIDYISRITVAGKGASNTYSLSGKGKELVVTDEKSGNAVDTHNFRQFYRVLLMTEMEGYAENRSTDDWMLTFTIETTAGKIYEYKFYRISTRKCYYTVNGVGEFFVSIDDVEKILSDSEKLASGIKINADAQM